MGVPRWMVALSVQLVVAQRLVRTICPNCTVEHEPTAHELVWLKREWGDQAEGKPLRYGRGCPDCGQTGFKGRTGVYEFLEMTQPLIEAMSDERPGVFNKAAREAMAGNTLRRDAARLVLAGRTTVDEAMRVSAEVD
jgi:MSHA biogenesis protein MshE